MNIFFLHRNIRKCARYHLDRHVVKMILEYAQLLCTCIWVLGGEAPYKKTHENHPCSIWVRKSKSNWVWLRELALALCEEYTKRYGKTHKSQEIIEKLQVPNLPDPGFTDPPQAMPDEYKNENCVVAYRNYYCFGKERLHRNKSGFCWKKTKIPHFILRVFPEYVTDNK